MNDAPNAHPLSRLDPSWWKRVDEILDQALELPRGRVSEYLAQACAGDPGLRADVESLLRADESAGTFLERPVAEVAPELVGVEPPPEETQEGRRIGPWRIQREIGRGGMGAVYLAERADGSFEQRVALKLIKRGLDSDEVLDRFLQERQILARLEHPNIARLVDGGLTDGGQPWFAMEYVEGEPITDWCRRHDAGVGDRLRLFRAVCAAVQHAHRRLVVHRDLKPGNVLVTADGQVRLLDFGIAKLLAGGENADLTLTSGGAQMLTPRYAAPEQIRGEAITTATDVYALGVVLYELLAGASPYPRATTAKEVRRAVVEHDPPPPSVAAGRRDLRGDLDAIVLTALRKEPEARYPSAEAFDEDLGRFLDGLPVRARRPTPGYRTMLFVGRHRLAVAAGIAVALSLVGGLLGVSWQARRARLEARHAAEIRDFALGLFRASDPNEAKGDTLTAREILDRGADRVGRELTSQPAIQAEMFQVLGGVYEELGVLDRAQVMLERAAQLNGRTFGPSSPRTAASLSLLGSVLTDRAEHAAAERVLRRAIATYQRSAPRDTGLADATRRLGVVYHQTGRTEAESLYRAALALDEAHPDRRRAVAQDLVELGTLFYDQRDFTRAREIWERALPIQVASLGREHLATATTIENLASVESDSARCDSLHLVALSIRRSLLGAESMPVANTLSNLGARYLIDGMPARAESAMVEARRIYALRLGPDHIETARATNNLAFLLASRWRLAEAESLYRIAISAWSARLGENHVNTLIAEIGLASVERDRGEYADAERRLARIVARAERALGPEHQVLGRAHAARGVLALKSGRIDEAERLLRRALVIRRADHNAGSREALAQTLCPLGELALADARVEEAKDLYLEAWDLSHGRPRSDTVAESMMGLGRALSAGGQQARAESLLTAALESRQRDLLPTDPRRARAALALGLGLARGGDERRGRAMLEPNLSVARIDPRPWDSLVREAEAFIQGRRRPSGRRPKRTSPAARGRRAREGETVTRAEPR